MKKIFFLLTTLLFAGVTQAQIAVTVTNPSNTTPNLSPTYTSLANALTALNGVTAMTGPVTLTLAAGGAETAPPTGLTIGSASLNPVLSATNTVTIVKAAGAATVINAGVGTATPGSAAPDGILKLTGADYITIDGLTFTDGNAANPATMEFGVGLFKLSAGDGCNNNTIQNCIFNMQRINNAAATAPLLDGAVAIEVINATAAAATTALTPTNGGTLATNGTNSFNKFYTNTINGGNIGIGFNGYAASVGVGPTPVAGTFLGDLGNDVGGTGAGTGNVILNFGGAAAAANPAAGIRANNQWSMNIQYNNINNNNGAGANHIVLLRGIYGQAGTSANVTISNNTISLKGGGTTTAMTGIENVIGATAAGNTVTITGNIIQNCTYATATTATFTGILAGASATNQNVNNNQVINNTVGAAGTGSSCTIQGIYASASSTNFTANNNTVSGNVAANSFATIYSIRASTSVLNYDGNTISNNTIPNSAGATSSSVYGFYDASSPVTENYTNNNINNLTITGSSTATGHIIYGIYILTASGVKTISGNNINNLNFTSSGAGYATINGIRDAYASTANIFKNVIHSLSSTGTTPSVVGISFGTSVGTTFNVYNNLVGNLTAPQSTGFNIQGILCGSVGTTYNVSFNTVYLNGTSSGSGSASAALYMSSTTPTVNMIDNLLVNLCTPTGTGITAAVRRTAAALTAYGTTSNNNFFYAGTPSANNVLYYDGTNAYQTMATLKAAVAPRESASVSEVVSSTAGVYFQSFTGPATGTSTTFLHIVNGLATQSESGGTPVAGITDDYDGTTRNVTTPDIGADEFNGILVDLTPPTISYSPIPGTLCISNPTLSATITDPSNVNITPGTKPRVYYKKSTNANTFVDNTNGTDGWKFVEASNAASPFTFTLNLALINGGVAAGNTIQYFVVAQDIAATPNVGINSGIFAAAPSSVALTAAAFPLTGTINSYAIGSGGLSGTVTIGAAGTYTSLTGAGGLFSVLNAGGLTGNLTANIIDASVTESGANALNAINYGCGGPFTLTIKPSTTATLTGSVASGGLIKLNGASNVIIDGSNSGGTDRSLTITNTNTTAPTAISIASLGTGAGASNVVVKNCNISTGVATTIGYGISVGGATPGTAGADNDNVTIQNNSITNAPIGIFANGTTAVSTGGDDNLIITGNTVDYNNVATGLASIGIQAGNSLGSTISLNTVSQQTSSSQAPTAISLETGFVSSTVTRNKVTVALTTNTGGYGGRGLTVGTGTATSNLTISNNVIYGVNGSNWSGFSNSSSMAVAIGTINSSSTITTTTGGINLYHNSVNISGSMGAGSTSAITTALYIGSGASALDIRNNVFANTQVGTSTTQKNYAIYAAGTNSAFTSINNNDYFVSNSFNAGSALVGFLTSDRATLANWQSASGQDANSIAGNPLFNSATNLQPQPGSPVSGAGANGTGVTVDFLGVARGTPPAIGAYEQTLDGTGPSISYTPFAGTLCAVNRTLSATITDASGVNVTPGTKPRIYFKKSTDANTFAGNTSANNGWKFSEAANAASPFSLTIDYSLLQSPAVGGDVIQYFVVAQDLATTPNVSINSGIFATAPASVALAAANFPLTGTINSYTLGAGGLSGTVTIGAAGTYTSLTNAGGLFATINAGGLTGNLTVNILDPSITETGTNALNSINYGCGGPFTLLIKPNAGVNATLTGTNANSLIKLNGADFVTIDGVNTGGSSLKITNTNAATTATVIWIASNGADGATNNTIKNATIAGTGTTTISCILAGDGATFGGAATAANSNNTIQNDTLRAAQNGIFISGFGTPPFDQNWLITQNFIGSTSVAADKMAFRGMGLINCADFAVTKNVIAGVISSATSSSTMTGISVFNNIANGVIDGNKISDIKQVNTTGWGSNGIGLFATTTASNLTVSNNFISDVASYGFNGTTASDNGYGIMAGASGAAGSGYNIYYNTISMNTNQTAATGLPAAINISSDIVTANSINLRNNIFSNSQTVGTNRYAILVSAASSVLQDINYNDYYFGTSPNLGNIGGTNRANLAAWQTGTGKDANSTAAQPVFVSATDLHLSNGVGANWCLDGKGTTIAGITVDYDGQTRNTPPDIGADEFTAVGTADIATPASQTVCSGTAITTIVLSGGASSYSWTRDNAVSVTGIAASGTGNISGTLTNTTTAPITVTFTISALNAAGCAGPATFTATVLVNPTPNATATPSSQTICSASAITTIALSGAVSGTTYNWTRDNTVAVTGIAASGSGNISGTLTNTTAAPVTVTFTITPTANGCPGTPITATVLVNPTPDAVAAPSSQTICSASAITTIALSGAVSGTTYNWTRDNTVAVTGIAASGSGNISGSLTNTTNAPVTVTFTITPTANGCPGTPITATVLVNPTPNVTATPSSQTSCSGTAITTIALSSTTAGTTTYSWTRDNTVAVTGIAASGSGNISGTLTNTTIASVTVTFTITPSNSGCPGLPITATVTVDPIPDVTQPANQTVCNNSATAPVNFSGSVAGTIFNWTNSNTTIGLGASGTGDIPAFTATNSGTAPVTATVTVTPSYTSAVTSQTFNYTGGAQTWTVPAGVTSVTIETWGAQGANGINGSTTPVLSAGGTGGKGGYAKGTLAVTPGQVLNIYVGGAGSGSTGGYNGGGNGGGNSTAGGGGGATDIRVGGTALANRVIVAGGGGGGGNGGYYWTGASFPINGGNGGDGNGQNGVNGVNSNAGGGGGGAIGATGGIAGIGCGGFPAQAGINGNNGIGGNGGNDGNCCSGIRAGGGGGGGGYTGGGGGAGAGVGTVGCAFNDNGGGGGGAGGDAYTGGVTAATTSNGIQSGNGMVILTFGSSAPCAGTPKTFTYTVNPTATVNPVANQAVCSGATTAAVSFSSPTTGGTIVYNWTNDQPGIGLAASGTGNIPAFTATNAGATAIVATITVTPSYTNGVTCTGTPMTFTITVNPLPALSSSVTQPTTCVSADGAINLTVASPAGPYTFAWTGTGVNPTSQNQTGLTVGTYNVTVTVNATGCQNSATINLIGPGGCSICPTIPALSSTPNIACSGQNVNLDVAGMTNMGITYGIIFKSSTTPLADPYTGGTVIATIPNGGLTGGGTGANTNTSFATAGTYYVYAILTPTPIDPSCRPFGFKQLQVDQSPSLAPVANITYCRSTPTAPIVFGASPGASVNWTNSNTAIGLAAGGSGNIPSFVTTNATTAPITATITATPFTATCTGTPVSFTITVNPTATVNAVANQTLCAGAATAAVNFSSPTTGGTLSYGWTNSNTLIGLAASGTGNIASFTAANPTTAPITATITVTPYFTNGGVTCAGTPISFTITVNPVPTVNAVGNQVLCNGATTLPVLFTGSVPGTVYNWTNNNTAIGLAASGTGNIAAFVATNATTAPITATITVTPSFTSGAVTCTGTPRTFTITVNPTAVMNTPANITVCNNATAGPINFTSANTGGTLTYAWSNTNPTIGLASSGIGNIGAFVATNLTNAPVTATITVTPTFTNGGVSCTGNPVSFTITVNPTPVVNPPLPGNQVLCNGSNTAAVTFTSSQAGVFFQWTNNQPSIGLAGAGVGNIPSFTATNTGTAPVVATVTVTPVSATGCPGTPVSFTITVNPTPAVNAIANQSVCNGAAVAATTPAGPVAGTVYSWTNNNTSIGLASGGTGTIPGFTAINNGTAPVVATITVTPNYTNAGVSCAGTPVTYTITVNPTATMNAVANKVLCNGTATGAINFSSAVAGTTYAWTNSNTAIGLGASGTGNIASFTATNATSAPITATITVTPTAGTCAGTPVTFTITVNPTATVNAIANQTVCNGSTTTAVTPTSSVAGVIFNWTIDNPSIGVGLVPAGTGNFPSFTAINTTSSPITATVTYTATLINGGTSCVGPVRTFTITVNPSPNVVFTNMPPRVCLTDTVVVLNATPAGGVWSGRGVVNNTFNAKLAGLGASTITYTYTNSSGCTNAVNATIVVNDCIERHNVFATAIRIYPNPSSGRFNIRFLSDVYKEFNVRIVAADGKVMKEYHFTGLMYGSVIPMNETNLSSGEYFLEVYNTQEKASFPFVIVH